MEAQITRLTPTAVRVVASTMHFHLDRVRCIEIEMAFLTSVDPINISRTPNTSQRYLKFPDQAI
jgi:hypothetical protein